MRVQSALGVGLYEKPYKVCLAHALRQKGHRVLIEVKLDITFEGLLVPESIEPGSAGWREVDVDSPVLGHGVTDHRSVQGVQRREQRRGAMPLVVVGHGSAPAPFQWQAWLGAGQGLDLALLVHREHHRMLRRIEIEADDVLHLLGEPVGRIPVPCVSSRRIRDRSTTRAGIVLLRAQASSCRRSSGVISRVLALCMTFSKTGDAVTTLMVPIIQN